jgi:hypothetical protein
MDRGLFYRPDRSANAAVQTPEKKKKKLSFSAGLPDFLPKIPKRKQT